MISKESSHNNATIQGTFSPYLHDNLVLLLQNKIKIVFLITIRLVSSLKKTMH